MLTTIFVSVGFSESSHVVQLTSSSTVYVFSRNAENSYKNSLSVRGPFNHIPTLIALS